MTTPDDHDANDRRPRFQFSLRALLLAFTAVAIGFPIWYRWPYQETELRYPMTKGVPDRTKPPQHRIVTTWQRTWGGKREKHGPLIKYNLTNNGRRVEHYEHDVLHGPFTQSVNDIVYGSGQYYRGEPDGTWISKATREKGQDTTNWRHGKLHGLVDFDWPEQPRHEWFQYADGRLTHYNGEPVKSRLLNQASNNEIPLGRLRDAINGEDFRKLPILDDVPLSVLCETIETRLQIPVTIDASVSDPTIHVYFGGEGMDFPSALFLCTRYVGLDWECRGDGLVVFKPE
jgi:hypothetical protein